MGAAQRGCAGTRGSARSQGWSTGRTRDRPAVEKGRPCPARGPQGQRGAASAVLDTEGHGPEMRLNPGLTQGHWASGPAVGQRAAWPPPETAWPAREHRPGQPRAAAQHGAAQAVVDTRGLSTGQVMLARQWALGGLPPPGAPGVRPGTPRGTAIDCQPDPCSVPCPRQPPEGHRDRDREGQGGEEGGRHDSGPEDGSQRGPAGAGPGGGQEPGSASAVGTRAHLSHSGLTLVLGD